MVYYLSEFHILLKLVYKILVKYLNIHSSNKGVLHVKLITKIKYTQCQKHVFIVINL